MKKDKELRNENNAAPCKHCKKKGIIVYPYVSQVDDLYYARCPNCNFYDQYEFLGLTEKKAIDRWNNTMEAKQGDYI